MKLHFSLDCSDQKGSDHLPEEVRTPKGSLLASRQRSELFSKKVWTPKLGSTVRAEGPDFLPKVRTPKPKHQIFRFFFEIFRFPPKVSESLLESSEAYQNIRTPHIRILQFAKMCTTDATPRIIVMLGIVLTGSRWVDPLPQSSVCRC